MAKTICAITTYDNPFDPFDQFDSWYMFDMNRGYNTCGWLGRLAMTSDALSDSENNEEIERVINDIIKYDPTGMYIKVTREIA